MLLLTSTATGARLVALWKPKMCRWYIVVESEDEKEKSLKKVIDKLTPSQFQEAVENGFTPLNGSLMRLGYDEVRESDF